MTETLMNCAVRAAGDRRPGTVGPPVDGVHVRLVDDDGTVIQTSDDATIGEIQVRGPNLFLEYLNRRDATAEAMQDGWFETGDVATRAPDGYIRIVGRSCSSIPGSPRSRSPASRTRISASASSPGSSPPPTGARPCRN